MRKLQWSEWFNRVGIKGGVHIRTTTSMKVAVVGLIQQGRGEEGVHIYTITYVKVVEVKTIAGRGGEV